MSMKNDWLSNDRRRSGLALRCRAELSNACLVLRVNRTCRGYRESVRGRDGRYRPPPRTEPRERNSRTRLPPWVCDGKTHARPWMKGCWLREIVGCDLRDPLPRRAILLAAALQRAQP